MAQDARCAGSAGACTKRREANAIVMSRTLVPTVYCWRIRARPREEALTIGQDGEERDA